MTKEDIINGLEIYTVGKLKKSKVDITVEELQRFIDAIKTLEKEPILDKIKEEIKQVIQEETVVDSTGGEYERIESTIKPDDVFEILDKYKKESEEENADSN